MTRMRRLRVGIAILSLAACVLALGACGGGAQPAAVASAAEEAAAAFRSWLTHTDEVITDFNRGKVSAGEVHLPLAPPKSQLRLLAASQEAFFVSFDAQLSQLKLKTIAVLRDEDVKAGYCFLFSAYVENGTIPTPEQLESNLFYFVIGRALPPPPLKQLEGTVKLFRNSIVKANSAPQAVANLSMATVCSR